MSPSSPLPLSQGSVRAAGVPGTGSAAGHENTTAPVHSSAAFLCLVATCTAVTVADIYLAGALLPLIARDFGAAPSSLTWIASVAQLGYAVGLLLFAPLGGRVSRRGMVTALTAATALALAAAAAAPGTGVLACAVFATAAVAVVPQLLVPLIAERAPVDRRALHVAAVIAGLFTGIVAARVVGGLAGQAYGWRPVLLGAGVLTLAVGLLTAAVLPAERRGTAAGRLFGAHAALPGTVRRSPALWRACVRQAGMFGAWSALWTSLALLLTGSAYGLSTATAGLFGLFGLAAGAMAPLAGGLVDRHGAGRVVRAAYLLCAVSVPLFLIGGRVVAALVVGAVAVHVALVASHVANQTLALTTTSAPATANTAYVVAGFAGGAVMSLLAGSAYGRWGWRGVCAVAALSLAGGWAASRERGAGRGADNGPAGRVLSA